MNLGENIKNLRTKLNITQKEMSDTLGYSCQNISKWERGTSMPDIPTVIALAKYFKVSVDELLGASSDGNSEDQKIQEPKIKTLRFHTDINTQTPFTTWTDFECEGTIAPNSVFFPGRHRTSEPRWSFPAFQQTKLIIAVNASGKISNMFYMLGARNHEIDYALGYYHALDEKYSCITATNDATTTDWIRQLKFEFLLPQGGFLIVADVGCHRSTNLLRFMLPKSMHDLFPCTASDAKRKRGTRYDDGCLIRECFAPGSLDHIDIKLENGNLVFTSPVDPNESEIQENASDPCDKLVECIAQLIEEKLGLNLFDLTEKLETLEESIDILQGEVYELQGEIEELEEKVDDLE